MTRFFFLFDNCRFFDVWCLLWWEDGFVTYSYNCFWALPEQSLLHPSPAKLTTIFYCLIQDYPNLGGQVPVFISTKTGWPNYTPGHWVPFSSPLKTRRARVEVLYYPNLGGQVLLFISPKTRWPSYTPGHWVPFSSPLKTRRARVEVL
jgi:hypothetical protein